MHRSGSSPGGSPRKCSTRMQTQEALTQQQQPPRIQNTRGLQKTSRGLLRLAHIVLRRHRYMLIVAPLLYVMGAFFYMKSLPSVQSPTVQSPGPPAGSLYRSPQLFLKLWPDMLSDNSSANVLTQAWGGLKKGQRWRSCIRPTSSHLAEMPPANGYMVIEANGGLNQQRMSICDAVAVAGLLNATLVIPSFHFNSVWRDPSNFSDIFDEDYFIQTLQNDVRVVGHLPEAVLEKFNYNISNVVNLRLKASTSVNHYLKKVLPNLIENGVIRVSPFANRLPSDVPINIQRLRCLANYEALRFSKPIASLGSKLVDRMVKHSLNSDGKYISVHLRFEEDMVAFSCCIYDGGEEEKRELDIARDRAWRGKFQKHGRVIRPDANRRDGKCPLTPLEVGMVLRAMGFDNSTSIYLAAGKIYRAEKYMEPLTRMFPLLQTKESLATPEELAPFKKYSSRMAALDYTVCLHSEIFFTTQGGNFPHFLVGHRRYLNNGHSKTLKPDKRKLAVLFDNPNIRWDPLKEQMKSMLRHSDMKGVEGRKANSSIYSFPTPECMCRSNRN